MAQSAVLPGNVDLYLHVRVLIAIILGLLIFGAFYFWGARLSKENAAASQVPYIPSGTTTLPEITK